MDAKDAVVLLSSLAADFKIGVVSTERVQTMITVIVEALNLSESEKVQLRTEALSYWGIEV